MLWKDDEDRELTESIFHAVGRTDLGMPDQLSFRNSSADKAEETLSTKCVMPSTKQNSTLSQQTAVREVYYYPLTNSQAAKGNPVSAKVCSEQEAGK